MGELGTNELLILTPENFETEILKFSDLAIVDFYATWCGPCKQQAPVMEKIAKENTDQKIKIGKFNVDDDKGKKIAIKHKIFSVPTIIFFQSGKEIKRLIGYTPKEKLQTMINEIIKGQ